MERCKQRHEDLLGHEKVLNSNEACTTFLTGPEKNIQCLVSENTVNLWVVKLYSGILGFSVDGLDGEKLISCHFCFLLKVPPILETKL